MRSSWGPCAGLLLLFLGQSAVCESIASSVVAVTPAAKTDWFSHPPGWITWLSLAGGLTAFGWKLYEFIISRVDREKDQRIACDAFWYESIVVPRIVVPLIDFLGQQQEALRALQSSAGGETFTKYMSEYQAKYSDLATRMSLLQVISKTTHADIMAHLDGLEDAITVHCYDATQADAAKPKRRRSPDMSSRFSDAMNVSVKKLKELHFALRHSS